MQQMSPASGRSLSAGPSQLTVAADGARSRVSRVGQRSAGGKFRHLPVITKEGRQSSPSIPPPALMMRHRALRSFMVTEFHEGFHSRTPRQSSLRLPAEVRAMLGLTWQYPWLNSNGARLSSTADSAPTTNLVLLPVSLPLQAGSLSPLPKRDRLLPSVPGSAVSVSGPGLGRSCRLSDAVGTVRTLSVSCQCRVRPGPTRPTADSGGHQLSVSQRPRPRPARSVISAAAHAGRRRQQTAPFCHRDKEPVRFYRRPD